MLKQTARVFLVTIFLGSSALAEDSLSNFNQQGDMAYPEPLGEESYLAQKAPMPAKSSWYFGINTGANVNHFSPKVWVGDNASDTQKRIPISYAVGMYSGYGINFSHFYIGSELSAYYNFLNRKTLRVVGQNNIKLSVKQPLTVNFDIIPGFITEARDVLFYGRLGLGTGLMKLGFIDITNGSSNAEDKVNRASFCLRAGLGVEYFINDFFSLRTEYIYSRYNKINGDRKIFGTNAYSYKLEDFKIHQVNLGLTIRF